MSENKLKRTPLLRQPDKAKVAEGHVIRGAMTRISVFENCDANGNLIDYRGTATIIPSHEMSAPDYAALGIDPPSLAAHPEALAELIRRGLANTGTVGVRLVNNGQFDAQTIHVRRVNKKNEAGQWVVIRDDPKQKIESFMRLAAEFNTKLGKDKNVLAEVIQIPTKPISLKKRGIGNVPLGYRQEMIDAAAKYRIETLTGVIHCFAPTDLLVKPFLREMDSYIGGFRQIGALESASVMDAVLNAQTETIRPPVVVSECILDLSSGQEQSHENDFSIDTTFSAADLDVHLDNPSIDADDNPSQASAPQADPAMHVTKESPDVNQAPSGEIIPEVTDRPEDPDGAGDGHDKGHGGSHMDAQGQPDTKSASVSMGRKIRRRVIS